MKSLKHGKHWKCFENLEEGKKEEEMRVKKRRRLLHGSWWSLTQKEGSSRCSARGPISHLDEPKVWKCSEDTQEMVASRMVNKKRVTACWSSSVRSWRARFPST